jgi:D-alanine-D-alanine ligase
MFPTAGICTLIRVQGTRAARRASAREEIAASTVAVLAGGRSSEREISLVSARAILGALAVRTAPDEAPGPARCVEIAIETDGAWRVDGERCDPAAAIAMLPHETLYFLGLHGGEGENGAVQGFLETASRRYTGSGVGASALCMDKRATRLVAREAGLAIAAGTRIDPFEWESDPDTALARAAAVSRDGWAVKPNAGGSSVATTMVERAEDLGAAIEAALATGDSALVEERIRGTEATCAVLGNASGDLRALTPVEIVPRAGAYFDWHQKYAADGAEELCPPRTIAPEVCDRLKELAVRVHRAAGCDGYSRSDFIVPDGGSEPVFLEVNTLPGMTDRSLLPRSARAEGMSFRALCLEILALAVERFGP